MLDFVAMNCLMDDSDAESDVRQPSLAALLRYALRFFRCLICNKRNKVTRNVITTTTTATAMTMFA